MDSDFWAGSNIQPHIEVWPKLIELVLEIFRNSECVTISINFGIIV